MSLTEYILKKENDPDNWDFYKLQEACDWSANEFDFVKDKDDYLKSPKNIQKLIKVIIGFFLIGDGLISEDLVNMLQYHIEHKNWCEVYFISMQIKVENTHAELYSKAGLTIVPENEHNEILSMCEKLECIKEKGLWMKKNNDDKNLPMALKYVSCAVGEGIFFVSLFGVIFYLRKLGLFKNFIISNEQISKDETLHRNQKANQAKKLIKTDLEKSQAIDIIKSAVKVEKKFAKYLLSEPIISTQSDIDSGLTIDNFEKYIEMLADQVSYLCGLGLIYKTEVQLPWMEDINLSQKTNFYELDVVGNYRKTNLSKINTDNKIDVIDRLGEIDF